MWCTASSGGPAPTTMPAWSTSWKAVSASDHPIFSIPMTFSIAKSSCAPHCNAHVATGEGISGGLDCECTCLRSSSTTNLGNVCISSLLGAADYPGSERFHLHYADLIDFGSLCAVLKCVPQPPPLQSQAALCSSLHLPPQHQQSCRTRQKPGHGCLVPGSTTRMHACRATRPDEVYNLGAQSHVQVSFQLPQYTGEVDGMVRRPAHHPAAHRPAAACPP